MEGEPFGDLLERPVARDRDPAQRLGKLALLDQYGASEIDEGYSLHDEQCFLLNIVASVFAVYLLYMKFCFISFRDENQRHVAASQSRIGPDVVAEPFYLAGRFVSREYGDRLAAAAQQGGNPGVAGLEIAYGVVAARGDHGLDGLRTVVETDGNRRVDSAQQPDDILHECGVLARRLDRAAMSGRERAQEVEKSHERDVPGHDDEDVPGCGDGKRGVAGEPCGELPGLEHLVDQRSDGPTDVAGREPLVGRTGGLQRAARRCVVPEVAQKPS